VVTWVGWAEVPSLPELACTPQCDAAWPWPSEPAPALPVETDVSEPGWVELPALTVVGWTLTCPGGEAGVVSAAAGTARSSVSADARAVPTAAGLNNVVPPVYRVVTH
jgi:hypothetical protein